MPPFRKNLMVGLTVLLALGLLGAMIYKFGDAPARLFRPERMPVEFHAARSDGLSAGSAILVRGVNVGNVEKVALSEDQNEVVISALIDGRKPPAANVVGQIRSQLVGGGSTINLEVPDGQTARGAIQRGQTLRAVYVGVDVLPPAFNDLAVSLRQTVEDLRASKLTQNVNDTVLAVRETATAANRLLDSLQKIVGDDKMREDLRASVANFKTVTETARQVGDDLKKFSGQLNAIGGNFQQLSTKASASVDDLTARLNDRLEQVAKLLETFQQVSEKINRGQGTAGLLINDTKLYESLVDTSRELKLTMTEVKLLVQQVQQEGFHLKLGK